MKFVSSLTPCTLHPNPSPHNGLTAMASYIQLVVIFVWVAFEEQWPMSSFPLDTDPLGFTRTEELPILKLCGVTASLQRPLRAGQVHHARPSYCC